DRLARRASPFVRQVAEGPELLQALPLELAVELLDEALERRPLQLQAELLDGLGEDFLDVGRSFFEGLQAMGSPNKGSMEVTVALEIRNARGELLAREIIPTPGQASPRAGLGLVPLGSAGALVETAVSVASTECRTLWRYRDGRLTRVPLLGLSGPVPDCGPPE